MRWSEFHGTLTGTKEMENVIFFFFSGFSHESLEYLPFFFSQIVFPSRLELVWQPSAEVTSRSTCHLHREHARLCWLYVRTIPHAMDFILGRLCLSTIGVKVPLVYGPWRFRMKADI